jgi:gpW
VASAAQIETWIGEAEVARHKLATGKQVTEAWRDGRRVIYAEMSLAQMDAYLVELRRDLATAQALEAGITRRRSPISVTY